MKGCTYKWDFDPEVICIKPVLYIFHGHFIFYFESGFIGQSFLASPYSPFHSFISTILPRDIFTCFMWRKRVAFLSHLTFVPGVIFIECLLSHSSWSY